MDWWKHAFVCITMNWFTAFIFISLVREAPSQHIGSSHSSSSSSSSSSSRSSSSSSSRPHSGNQGFSNFAPRSNFGTPTNSETHRIIPNGNHQPQAFQNNGGGHGSESFTTHFGQTFPSPEMGSQVAPAFPNGHPGNMMPRNHGTQFGHHNGQIRHQPMMGQTEQQNKALHQSQPWSHAPPGQPLSQNQQSGNIGQTMFDSIQGQQGISKPYEQSQTQTHPGQHLIPNFHGQQQIFKSPQQPQTQGHSEQNMFHNFHNQGHQMNAETAGQPQSMVNAGQQLVKDFHGLNTPGQLSPLSPSGQERMRHVSQSQHTQHMMPSIPDQNMMPMNPPQHLIHGNQFIHNLAGVQQNQDHQFPQNQGKPQSHQELQHMNGQQQTNPDRMINGHRPFENFQTSNSHSFEKSVLTPNSRFPQQIAKTVSKSVSTSDTFSKTPPLDRPLFPRNFIIPERLRNSQNMFPHRGNPFPPAGVRNSMNQNPSNKQPSTSQMNSRNIFGFESANRRHEAFHNPDQMQNMSSFHNNFQFENWDPFREQGVRRTDLFNFEIPTCTEEYQNLPNHTMCLVDTPNLNISGVSESEQLEIVRLHNDFRGNVLPEASDIFAMKWDDRLAIVAQKWANQCSRFHDKMRTVPSLGKHTLIGQNLAGGFSNWSSVIKEWWTENVIWQYGIEPTTYIPVTSDVSETIGHYIQMTYNATYLVGCGFAYCDDSRYEKYYVCNYAPGLRSFTHPFTRGERCRACPHWCRNGKCDCGGRVCNNGGTLNMKTCQCECGQLYAGPSCDILRCPLQDKPICGEQYQKDHCVVLPQVNQDCPYMCGRCARGQFFCGGRVCYNGGVLKETTCRCSCSPPYTGETCEANCSDPDEGQCNRWPDVFCHWNPQIQKQCPHRCNLCSKP